MSSQHSYKPRTTKAGIHINGWALSWPFIVAVVAVISNAAVGQHRIGELEKRVDELEAVERTVQANTSAVDSIRESLRLHNRYRHE